ncbi:hypothetical protein KPH14_005337 [Odynerus spinipes]|uniref:Uncharacterized protein n=1 Tax=Odynerus spinipes TaxID=1348599 RepID=A0AAD9VJ57_9HYME|nr:hypothetical protein KPH14_005337 [Odynerus spinipes]
MDPRCSKPRDFVAAARNLTEEIKKTRGRQMMWFQTYGPLLEEYENMKKEMTELCEKKHATIVDDSASKDKRSCLPKPETRNREYGWLATKSEFRLEKYGSYMIDLTDPLKKETLLQGDIPLLATGKGLLR